MASRTQVVLVDDVDGTELHAGEGETVLFALDGVTYEIDLTGRNAESYRLLVAGSKATVIRCVNGAGSRPTPWRSTSTALDGRPDH